MMTDFDFVKTIYSWGFPIDCYVLYRTITKDQYKAGLCSRIICYCN